MATSLADRWRGRTHDPVFWNDVIQLLKTVLAAVLAWVLATEVFSLPQPFLAPWAALLVVHATVYRTFSSGLRQVAAAVMGVVLAWGVGSALGLDTTSVAVVLILGLAIGAMPWFGNEAATVATTGLVVLTTGFSGDESVLVSRLGDTAIGIAVGLLVNAIVWPPLRRRTAIAAMDRIDGRIGVLLADMSQGLVSRFNNDEVADWVDRTRSLDRELDNAWSLVRQTQESARMNPRRSARQFRDPQRWLSLLQRMDQAVADTRSMARTLGYVATRRDEWQPEFRDRWTTLLGDAGRAIADADAVAIRAIRERLTALVDDVGALHPTPSIWPVYGGLMMNLRNVLDAMGEVAAANPLSQPPMPMNRLRERTRSAYSKRRRDQT